MVAPVFLRPFVSLCFVFSIVRHVNCRGVHAPANAVRVFLNSHLFSEETPWPSVAAMSFHFMVSFLVAGLPGLGHVKDDEEHQKESNFSDH